MNNQTRKANTKSKKNGGQRKQQQGKAKRELILWPDGQLGRPNRVNYSHGSKASSIPSAYQASSRLNNSKVKMQRASDGSCVVKHCEYVQDIAGSVLFTSNALPIQPGLPTLFPYLSTMAVMFQDYQVQSLRFYYDTEKGTSLNGKVMFTISPDGADAVPSTKQEALNYNCQESCAIWSPMSLAVNPSEFKTLGERRFVRNGIVSSVGSDLDIKTYDVGQLFVSTVGMADTSFVGELYVEYSIKFMNPVMNLRLLVSGNSKTITGVSPSQTSLFGTTPTLGSGLDVTVTGNTLTFNKVGQFNMCLFLTGTGLFTSFLPVFSASTASVSVATSFSGISNAAANVGTSAMTCLAINVTERKQTAVIDCSTVSTTISTSFGRIYGFSGSLV